MYYQTFPDPCIKIYKYPDGSEYLTKRSKDNMESTAKRQNGHKTVRCTVCWKYMRSDNLNRHLRTHKDILSMTDEEAREELKERHELHKQRVEGMRRITKLSLEENIPIELCRDLMTPGLSPEIKRDTREEMILNKQEYLEKIELGKEVAACIAEQ